VSIHRHRDGHPHAPRHPGGDLPSEPLPRRPRSGRTVRDGVLRPVPDCRTRDSAFGGRNPRVLDRTHDLHHIAVRVRGVDSRDPDGTTNISTRFVQGQPQDIVVSALGGSTAGAFSVRIRLIPTNATGNETFHAVFQTAPLRMDAFAEYDVSIILGPRETWSRLF